MSLIPESPVPLKRELEIWTMTFPPHGGTAAPWVVTSNDFFSLGMLLVQARDERRGFEVERFEHADTPFLEWLMEANGYKLPCLLGDGRYAALMPLLFTTAIITGRVGDKLSVEDRWCFKDEATARRALAEWDGTGEPEGWHRHPPTGRRRKYDEELSRLLNEWVDE